MALLPTYLSGPICYGPGHWHSLVGLSLLCRVSASLGPLFFPQLLPLFQSCFYTALPHWSQMFITPCLCPWKPRRAQGPLSASAMVPGRRAAEEACSECLSVMGLRLFP